MSRKTRQPGQPAKEIRDAVTEYLAALEEIYPVAKEATRVIRRQDNRIIVSVPLPAQVGKRMRLFDHMAEIGTRLLLETDQYIILSGQ